MKLGELIDSLDAGVSVNSENRPYRNDEKGVLKTSAVTHGYFKPEENKVIKESELIRAHVQPKKDSIIISRMNTEQLVGASAYVEFDYDDLFLPDRLWQTKRARSDYSMKYVHLVISSNKFRQTLANISGGSSGSMKNISKKTFLGLSIPLPPLVAQNEIVAEFAQEQKLVEAQRKLIKIYKQKIKDKIAEVRGE